MSSDGSVCDKCERRAWAASSAHAGSRPVGDAGPSSANLPSYSPNYSPHPLRNSPLLDEIRGSMSGSPLRTQQQFSTKI